MKKVLLSLSFLAAVMSANAQTSIPVGTGAYDDMASVGDPAVNLTGEYNTAITVSGTPYTSGIFWWQDAVNPSDYVRTRANGELSIAVTKSGNYSPIGFGFGDTNGDGTGTPFSIDISNAKTVSFKAKATAGTTQGPTIFIQVTDANGINGEIHPVAAGLAGDDTKYGAPATGVLTTYSTYNLDITGMMGQTDPTATANNNPAGFMWPCATWPTDCPKYSLASTIDFTKIIKVSFFISGGTAYTGTVTIDDVKVGAPSYLGLGTTAAAANIGSTKLFPNPTDGMFTAELNLKAASTATIIVTDMMGRQIAVKELGTITTASESFNTAGLAKGMYTVTYVLNGTPAKSELVVVR